MEIHAFHYKCKSIQVVMIKNKQVNFTLPEITIMHYFPVSLVALLLNLLEPSLTIYPNFKFDKNMLKEKPRPDASVK